MRPISEVLDLAADEIQRRGWATGGDANDPWGRDSESNPVCLEGAIFAVVYGDQHVLSVSDAANLCPAGKAVRDYLGMVPFDFAKNQRLYDYNDQVGRTAQEVVEVLRATAAVERVKESAGIEVPA